MWIRLAVAAFVLYLLYRICRSFFGPKSPPSVPVRKEGGGEDLVQDPVCGVYIPESSAYKATLDGRTAFFCSRRCYEKLLADRAQSKKGET